MGGTYGGTDIVDSFDDQEDYENNGSAIPSNAVISVEADTPDVPQIRAFVTTAFLGRDVALLLLSSSLPSSSKLRSSNG